MVSEFIFVRVHAVIPNIIIRIIKLCYSNKKVTLRETLSQDIKAHGMWDCKVCVPGRSYGSSFETSCNHCKNGLVLEHNTVVLSMFLLCINFQRKSFYDPVANRWT